MDYEVGRVGLRTFGLYMEHGPLRSHPFLGPAGCPWNYQVWGDGTCTAQCLAGVLGFDLLLALRAAMGEIGKAPRGHAAPHIDCSCGIYASLSYNHLLHQYPSEGNMIVAVIAAEGETILGTRGLRTQYARVIAYWAQGDQAKAARRQFKDAQCFPSARDMLITYDIPLEGREAAPSPHSMGFGWWTA